MQLAPVPLNDVEVGKIEPISRSVREEEIARSSLSKDGKHERTYLVP